MWCKCFSLFPLALLHLAVSPGRADVVPISISQQVVVSAFALACDSGCEMRYGLNDGGTFFSSSSGNTQLPPTSLSTSGGASDEIPFFIYTRGASAYASANQDSTLTASNVQVDLGGDGQLSGNDTLMYASFDAKSQYSLVFDLTSQSIVDLTGTLLGESKSGFFTGSLDNSFGGKISLSGSGFQFDQTLSLDSGFELGPFMLGPGTYTLDAVSDLNTSQGYFPDSSSSLQLDLNADFTPIVPEPKWSVFVPALLVVAAAWARLRKRRPVLIEPKS